VLLRLRGPLGGRVTPHSRDVETVEHTDTGLFSDWAISDRPISAPAGVSMNSVDRCPERRGGCEDGEVSTELIDRARSGDEAAFEELIGPYRRELHVHCYRILGSVADADDALQETLTAAWRGLASFGERASIRTWLYRVATSRCLNMVRSAKRGPSIARPVLDVERPEPTRLTEVVWLEPYPDFLLAMCRTAPLAQRPVTRCGKPSRSLSSRRFSCCRPANGSP
jgi:hypothetical protein